VALFLAKARSSLVRDGDAQLISDAALSIDGLLHVGEDALCGGVFDFKTLDRIVSKRTRRRFHDSEQALQITDDDRPAASVAPLKKLTKPREQWDGLLARRVGAFRSELGCGPTRGSTILFAMAIAERAVGVAFCALAVFALAGHSEHPFRFMIFIAPCKDLLALAFAEEESRRV
jgi:hypothetical protein